MLTARDILTVLSEFGLEAKDAGDPGSIGLDPTWRFERLGGIAGNARTWRIVHRRRPHLCTDAVHTVRGLRRIVREYLAGIDERPPDRTDYITYPKLNHNRFGDFWIWVQRRRERPQ